MTHIHERLRYRLVTGPDGADFAVAVSALLDEGYELYGSPAITTYGAQVTVAQAVVLPAYQAARYRSTTGAEPVS